MRRSSRSDDNGPVRRALRWCLVGPPVATLLAFAEVAARVQPPAPRVATWCFHAAAILLVLKLSVWIATSERPFQREERLGAFVALCAIGVGWYSANNWVGEREFAYLVASQDTTLRLKVSALSAEILAFVATRAHHAPPPPRPATWDRDVAAFDRYEAVTVQEYEDRFGRQVRSAHDTLQLYDISDKDLDVFYRHPASAFQIQIVGARLGSLAARFSAQFPGLPGTS
jgi:hypothetical protein